MSLKPARFESDRLITKILTSNAAVTRFAKRIDTNYFLPSRKLMKYWLQSFLIGIETVVVGFRDKKGALKTLEGLKVSEMPRRVRSQGIWDPNAILLMGDLFFTWLHERVMHYAKPCSRGLEVSFRIRHVEGGIIDFDLLPELPSFIPIWFTQYS